MIEILGDDAEYERKGVYKLHFEKFGVDPIIMGIYWDDIEELERLIMVGIEDNIPYDETDDFNKNAVY